MRHVPHAYNRPDARDLLPRTNRHTHRRSCRQSNSERRQLWEAVPGTQADAGSFLANDRYQRLVGELKGLGIVVSATTVRKVLHEGNLGPAGKRGGTTWREFLRSQARSLIAVDFFTVETVWLQRLYVLFFIELSSRRVHFAGCTSNPSSQWVTQQARQLAELSPRTFCIFPREFSSFRRHGAATGKRR